MTLKNDEQTNLIIVWLINYELNLRLIYMVTDLSMFSGRKMKKKKKHNENAIYASRVENCNRGMF
jgi:hypothetical protein